MLFLLGFGGSGFRSAGVLWTMCGWNTAKSKVGLVVWLWQVRHVASVMRCFCAGMASCVVPMPWQLSHCTLPNLAASSAVWKPPGCL